ncbi:hypothetical protein F5888DRAFT_1635649 [Russula emetica]|nr:hypothetical protein F5888DRAFT_1635649 [Russula emetica]
MTLQRLVNRTSYYFYITTHLQRPASGPASGVGCVAYAAVGLVFIMVPGYGPADGRGVDACGLDGGPLCCESENYATPFAEIGPSKNADNHGSDTQRMQKTHSPVIARRIKEHRRLAGSHATRSQRAPFGPGVTTRRRPARGPLDSIVPDSGHPFRCYLASQTVMRHVRARFKDLWLSVPKGLSKASAFGATLVKVMSTLAMRYICISASIVHHRVLHPGLHVMEEAKYCLLEADIDFEKLKHADTPQRHFKPLRLRVPWLLCVSSDDGRAVALTRMRHQLGIQRVDGAPVRGPWSLWSGSATADSCDFERRDGSS